MILLVKLIENNVSTTEQDLTIIINFFKIVCEYIESKGDYPDNISDNPILKEEFNQIKFIINLIVTPAIRNILLNQIYQGLKEMDETDSIIKDQKAVLDEIISVKFNGETLDSYLNNVLPKAAIKYFINVYNNDYDSDRKILNGSDLFNPLIQIIKENRLIQLTDDSVLIKNLKDYMIPFMINTYQNIIHHLRLTIYGYERYLLNTYQSLKTYQTVKYFNISK